MTPPVGYTEMKDSGIPWIGKIPPDWILKRIKYLCNEEPDSFIDGDWIESPYIIDSGIRYLTTGNIGDGIFKKQGNGYITNETFEKLNCKFAYPGDLVISRLNAPYGRACILPADEEKYVLAVDNVILRTDENKTFLCYLMQCEGYQNSVQDGAKGTTMKRISRTNLGNVVLPIPPLHIQSAIAAYLDTECAKIDEIIAEAKASIEEYKQWKASVIYEAVTKGLDPDAEMKDSGVEWIGTIPKTWKTIKFKHLHDGLNTGEGIDKNFWSSEENDRVFFTAGLLPIRTSYDDFPTWKYTTDHDLLLARNGTPYVYFPEAGACYTDHIIRAIMKKGINRKYVQYSLQQSIASVVVDTVSIATWSASLWNEQVIAWPTDKEQSAIAAYLDNQCAKIDELIAEKEILISNLEAYKKSLIYEVVTGKRRVC